MDMFVCYKQLAGQDMVQYHAAMGLWDSGFGVDVICSGEDGAAKTRFYRGEGVLVALPCVYMILHWIWSSLFHVTTLCVLC
jgi:hypothetical protein